MTTWGEKAKQGGSDLIRLASKNPVGEYKILHEKDEDLVDADEISDEGKFPEYGEFLKVEWLNAGPEQQLTVGNDGMTYLECPAGLGIELERLEVEQGDKISVDRVVKDRAGNWSFTCSLLE